MQGTITFYQLGGFIIFVLIAGVGGYAIVTLRNINGLIKEARAMLQINKVHLNQIIPNINQISENTARISEEFKKSAGEAGEAIRTISHETTETVLTINETADYLAKYAIVIGELGKMIINLFTSNQKSLK